MSVSVFSSREFLEFMLVPRLSLLLVYMVNKMVDFLRILLIISSLSFFFFSLTEDVSLTLSPASIFLARSSCFAFKAISISIYSP